MSEETNGLTHLILEGIAAKMQQSCIDAVPEDDKTRVNKVGLGGVETTGNERMLIIVRHMDPIRDDAAGDTVKGTFSEASQVFKGFPEGEIGGRTFEIVRGVIELRFDFTDSREDSGTADRYKQIVLSRAKQGLASWALVNQCNLTDSFGEDFIMLRVLGGTPYDSGVDSSIVGRYFLRWAALTETARPT
jgi:hypothetical protein